MKKKMLVLIFLGLFFTPLLLVAQARYECSFREYCQFNFSNEKLEACSGYVENSYFELNESGTELIHYTPDMTSYYFVIDRYYDAALGVLELNVISDANNKYTFYINESKNRIRVLFDDNNAKGLVVSFLIADFY